MLARNMMSQIIFRSVSSFFSLVFFLRVAVRKNNKNHASLIPHTFAATVITFTHRHPHTHPHTHTCFVFERDTPSVLSLHCCEVCGICV